MIVSNITTPLLGLVDTAILGHLPHPHMLAGVALASALISGLVWLSGFLRMSVTGLTAQALSTTEPSNKTTALLCQGILLALLISLPVLIFHSSFLALTIGLSDVDHSTAQSAANYYGVRIFAFPASLINLVLTGWLLAHGKAAIIMKMQISINLINLALDLITVYGLDMGVEGVAFASLVAEYCATLILLPAVLKRLDPAVLKRWRDYVSIRGSKHFITTNSDILIRSLLLQFSLLFMTFKGAHFGQDIVAANAILMNFLIFIALGLDGIAYAAEVLCGRQYGAKNQAALVALIKRCALLTGCMAVAYSLLFLLAGHALIHLMTDLDEIRKTASEYIMYIYWLPICAAGCFLLDGIFVGLADGKSMRNSMLISVLLVYFPLFYLLSDWQNHALWLALLGMMVMRSITLAWKLREYTRPDALASDKFD